MVELYNRLEEKETVYVCIHFIIYIHTYVRRASSVLYMYSLCIRDNRANIIAMKIKTTQVSKKKKKKRAIDQTLALKCISVTFFLFLFSPLGAYGVTRFFR